jgi:hypothetical protein
LEYSGNENIVYAIRRGESLDRSSTRVKYFHQCDDKERMMNIDMTGLENIRDWTEGKDRIFCVLALLIAIFEDDILESSEIVKRGYRVEGDIPLPHLKNWLKMYRNHQKVIIGVFNALSANNPAAEKLNDFYKEVVRGKLSSPTKLVNFLDLIETEVINIYREKKNEQQEETKKKRITELSNVKEIIFLLRVLFPCVTIYRVFPIDLLRNAESGDNESLKNLLRLDKSAIFHPKIREMIHQAQAEKKQERIYIIKKAFGSRPVVTMNPQKIRSSLAGLIQLISIRTKQKITVSEIYRLFNAIELDMGWGGVYPEEVKMKKTDEKTVKQYRRFWSDIIPMG